MCFNRVIACAHSVPLFIVHAMYVKDSEAMPHSNVESRVAVSRLSPVVVQHLKWCVDCLYSETIHYLNVKSFNSSWFPDT